MPGRLDEKVAVITGAASGIGLGMARRFVAEGARVVLGDIDAAGLEAAASELGPAASALVTDVTDEAQVAALCGEAIARFGRLDVAVAGRALRLDLPDLEMVPAELHGERGVELRLPLFKRTF